MSKEKTHGLTSETTISFHQELSDLLKKYGAHPEGSTIELMTQNLKFVSDDIRNCKPECVMQGEVCDHDGKNCHIKVWCAC